MSDLIDRHEAIRDIRLIDVCVIYDDMCSTEEAVEKAIVATKRNAIFGLECMLSAEHEQKKGEWIIDGHHIKCNRCENIMCSRDREGDLIPKNYCPNCGADMRGEQDEID